jgi:polysaccharide biosynthesis protein PslG
VRLARVASITAATILALLALAQPAGARVPEGFVGIVADGPLLDPNVDFDRELGVMKGAGTQSVRMSFHWSSAQPYRSFDEAPLDARLHYKDENGVPTDYTATDALVRSATERGLRLLPVVLYAPYWASTEPGSIGAPPSDPGDYARYLGALARRYGPNGSFWTENPTLPATPVRRWQVWNEPNIRYYWHQPFASGYVKLLRASRAELQAADPGARIVLGGLTNKCWKALGEIYAAGGKPYFDVVAIHPYTKKVSGLARIMKYVRDRMKQYKDARKPMVVTEMSWPSAKGHIKKLDFNEVTEKEQAQRVTGAFELMARNRRKLRIQAAYWYTWMSADRGGYYFDYAGLRKLTSKGPRSKPAFKAFRSVAQKLQR